MGKKKKAYFTLIFLFVFFLVFIFQNSIKNSIYSLTAPFQKFFWNFGRKISEFFSFYSNLSELKKRLKELEIENKKLRAEIEELRGLKEENEILKKGLKLKEEKFEVLPAKVLGKDIDQDMILIDRGREDGVFEGQVVISAEKILIGKVSKVYKNFSKVSLISSKDFTLNVKISSKKIEGLAKGIGGLNLILTLLPKEEKIEKGEKVVSSDLGGQFPPEILIGEVEKVDTLDFKSYQEAKLKLGFSLSQLESVFLIKNFEPWKEN